MLKGVALPGWRYRPPPLDSAASPPELHSTQIAGRPPESCPRVKLLGILTALLGSALVAVSAEQPGSKEKWAAPAAEARKRNPVAVNESSLTAGQKVYLKRCVGCHGKTGNGDGPNAADLGIHPAKLSDAVVREETDGELFYKITVGKKPMPNYGTRLSPTDRWNVINYLRTLARR
jgi:mono/diheme cytochrome c family protein